MNEVLSLCLPSRGRPKRFRTMAESAIRTAIGPVEFCVVIDADDPYTSGYHTLLHFIPKLKVVVNKQPTLHSDLWNVAWSVADGDIAMLCADDLVFLTRGWDEKVREQFDQVPDKILHVWCNDCTEHTEVATHPFIHRNWVKTVGFFTPPYFQTWYADTWLLMLGIKLRRQVFLKDVLIEHQHPTYNSAPMDATYERGIAARPTTQDNWQSRAGEREAQARKLLAVMDPDVRFDPGLDEVYERWGYPLDRV